MNRRGARASWLHAPKAPRNNAARVGGGGAAPTDADEVAYQPRVNLETPLD